MVEGLKLGPLGDFWTTRTHLQDLKFQVKRSHVDIYMAMMMVMLTA